MTKLILVRHGESMGNKLKLFTGHSNLDLTELGRKQADLLSEYLNQYAIDKIYSSDLSRAYNTALPTAKKKNLDIITSENLREIYAGKWEQMTFDDIETTYAHDYFIWRSDIGKAICTGGESTRDLKTRVEKEIHKIVCENEGKTIMVVSHGTPIRAMFTVWNNTAVENMQDILWVPNASVSIAEYENVNCIPKIILYGESSFLGKFKTSLPANV